MTSGLIALGATEREWVADAAPEVGNGGHPLERRDRLVVHHGATQPEPCRRRAHDSEATTNQADLVRVPIADVLAVEELERRRRAFGRAAVACRPQATRRRPHRRPGPELAARPRATTSTPSASNAPSSHCTFLPGRNVRATTCNGASGTGRSNSTVSRATNAAGPGSWRASTCAISALGAPPCIAFGPHGPRVSGVGTNCSPSRVNRLPCSETTSSDTASSDTGAHRRQRTATPTLTPTGPTLTPTGSLHTVDRRIGEADCGRNHGNRELHAAHERRGRAHVEHREGPHPAVDDPRGLDLRSPLPTGRAFARASSGRRSSFPGCANACCRRRCVSGRPAGRSSRPSTSTSTCAACG